MKDIYSLNLNSVITLEQGDTTTFGVIRVPGGWIYFMHIRGLANTTISQVFVPYNEEFKIKESV